MIFQIDKTIYEQLSETERYIVDFIIQNENKISYLSITNIADKTFSSPATVSRTIQKCGFKGIAELRYLISKEDKDKSKNVSPYAINKLLDKVYQESTQTIENIPIPAILKAIDHINNAEKIFIYARGPEIVDGRGREGPGRDQGGTGRGRGEAEEREKGPSRPSVRGVPSEREKSPVRA